MFEEFRRIAATAADAEADAHHVLAALADLGPLRTALDSVERDLIAAARLRGVAWAQLAEALGLRSRQAAEQRFLRLSAPAQRNPATIRDNRRGQRIVDAAAGPGIGELRAAVAETLRRIERDPHWAMADGRVQLALDTLQEAENAPPSALYALVAHAMADGVAFPGDRLQRAWDALTRGNTSTSI